MAEIKLQKRAVYVADVYAALVKAGYEDAAYFIQGLPSADVAPVRQQSCKFCCGAGYTEEDFTVITQLGRTVRTQFNFCPNCGRNLMRGADNG